MDKRIIDQKGYYNVVRYIYLEPYIMQKKILIWYPTRFQLEFLKQIGAEHITAICKDESSYNELKEVESGKGGTIELVFIDTPLPIYSYDLVIVPDISYIFRLDLWLEQINLKLRENGILLLGIDTTLGNSSLELEELIERIKLLFDYVYIREEALFLGYSILDPLEEELVLSLDSSLVEKKEPDYKFIIGSKLPLELDPMSIIQLPPHLITSVDFDILKQREEEFNLKLKELEEELKKAKLEIGNRGVNIAFLEQEIVKLKQKIAEEHNRFVETKIALEAEKKKSLSLEKELEIAKKMQLLPKVVTEKERGWELERRELEENIKKLGFELENTKTQLNESLSKKRKLEEELLKLKGEQEENQKKITNYELEVKRLKERLKILEEEREKLIDEKERVVRDFEIEKEELLSSLRQAENRVEEYQSKLSLTTKESERYKTVILELVKNLKEINTKEISLEEENIYIKEKLLEYLKYGELYVKEMEEKEKLIEENKDLVNRLKIVEERVLELENKLSIYETEVQALQKEKEYWNGVALGLKLKLRDLEENHIKSKALSILEVSKIKGAIFGKRELFEALGYYKYKALNYMERIKELEGQKGLLEQKIKEIEGDKLAIESAYNTQRETIRWLETSLEETRQRIIELESQLSVLCNVGAEKEREIKLLLEDKNFLEEETKKILLELKEVINDKIENLKKELIEKIGGSIDEKEEQFARILFEKEKEIKEKEEKIAHLEYELLRIEENKHNIEKALIELNEKLKEFLADRDELYKKREEELLYQINLLTNELEKKEAQIRDIFISLGDYPENIKEKLDLIIKENQELVQKLESTTSEDGNLIEKLEKEKTELKRQLDYWQHQYDLLKGQINEGRNELQSLLAKLERKEYELSLATKKLKELEEENRELRNIVDKYEHNTAAQELIEQRMKELEDKILKLEENNTKTEEKIIWLNYVLAGEKVGYKFRICELKEVISYIEEKTDIYLQEVNESRKLIEKLENIIVEYEKRIEELSSLLDKEREEKRRLEEKLEQRETTIIELNQKKTELEEKLKDLNESLERVVNELAEITEENNTLSEVLSQREEELDKLKLIQEENQKLKEELKKLHLEQAKVKGRELGVRFRLKELEARLGLLKRKDEVIKGLEERLNDLKRQYEELEKLYEEEEKVILKLREELSSKKEEEIKTTFLPQIEEYENQINSLKEKISELIDNLTTKEGLILTLEAKYDLLRNSMSGFVAKVEGILREIDPVSRGRLIPFIIELREALKNIG